MAWSTTCGSHHRVPCRRIDQPDTPGADAFIETQLHRPRRCRQNAAVDRLGRDQEACAETPVAEPRTASGRGRQEGACGPSRVSPAVSSPAPAFFVGARPAAPAGISIPGLTPCFTPAPRENTAWSSACRPSVGNVTTVHHRTHPAACHRSPPPFSRLAELGA